MVNTTGRSQITQVITAGDVTVAGNSTNLSTQRMGDESGAVQIGLNQDPGAGATGNFLIQGRLSPTAAWVTLQAASIVSFQGANDQIFTSIPILAQMRVRIDSPGTVTAGTTANVWIME